MPSDEIQTWFRAYRPQHIPTDTWEQVLRPFVEECLWALGDFTHLAAVRRYARVLAGIAHWCHQQAMPLDREVVLSPEVIEHYATVVLTGRAGPTYRADLRRLGQLVTKRARWAPPPPPLGRRQVVAPYSQDELARLWRAITQQPTPRRRTIGRALFLLGAGAGLDGRWVSAIDASSVRWHDDVLVVDVPDPHARTVPVWAPFAARLADLVAEVGHGPLAGLRTSSKNAVANAAARLILPAGVPPFAVNRLRSTWLLQHLEHGTRLPELVTAAGLEGITVLSDLLPVVGRFDLDGYCREVAGHDVESPATGPHEPRRREGLHDPLQPPGHPP